MQIGKIYKYKMQEMQIGKIYKYEMQEMQIGKKGGTAETREEEEIFLDGSDLHSAPGLHNSSSAAKQIQIQIRI